VEKLCNQSHTDLQLSRNGTRVKASRKVKAPTRQHCPPRASKGHGSVSTVHQGFFKCSNFCVFVSRYYVSACFSNFSVTKAARNLLSSRKLRSSIKKPQLPPWIYKLLIHIVAQSAAKSQQLATLQLLHYADLSFTERQ